MPTLHIPYLDGPDGPLPLRVETERLRLHALIEDLVKAAAKCREAGSELDALQCEIEADKTRGKLDLDADLSESAPVARIEYQAPTLDDRDAVRLAGAFLPDMKKKAVELLGPTWAGHDLPYPFMRVIEDACFGAVFPDDDEARRFFWIRRRLG